MSVLPLPQPTFHSGDFVNEHGGAVRGHIIGPGDHPGEWRICQIDGSETTCLAENLTKLAAPETPVESRERNAAQVSQPSPLE